MSRENEKFERYYNELGVVPENEKEEFWAALRRDLPNSFRFTGSRKYVTFLMRRGSIAKANDSYHVFVDTRLLFKNG